MMKMCIVVCIESGRVAEWPLQIIMQSFTSIQSSLALPQQLLVVHQRSERCRRSASEIPLAAVIEPMMYDVLWWDLRDEVYLCCRTLLSGRGHKEEERGPFLFRNNDLSVPFITKCEKSLF